MVHAHFSGSMISSIIGSVSKNISRLSTEDAPFFWEKFRQEPIYYCNSWLYTLRSTRDDWGDPGYKLVDEGVLIGVGYRNNIIYLVHPMGNQRFSTTLALCQTIQERSPYSIILKKLDQDLYAYLASNGLCQELYSPSSNQAPAHHPESAAFLEDETFPEHILRLADLYNDTSKRTQLGSFIRKVRRFEKSGITLSSRSDIADIKNQPGFSTLCAPQSEKYKSYIQMINETSNQRGNTYITRVYQDEHATVHGLYISETLATGTMGLYCAVSSKKVPGITEWMDYDFFQQLYREGVHTLYLGGSETKGVDSYVKKLLPTEPSYLLRPLYLPNRRERNASLFGEYNGVTAQKEQFIKDYS